MTDFPAVPIDLDPKTIEQGLQLPMTEIKGGTRYLIRLRGGPAENTLLQVEECPPIIYVQPNLGSSPYFLRGDVRVAMQAQVSIHRYEPIAEHMVDQSQDLWIAHQGIRREYYHVGWEWPD